MRGLRGLGGHYVLTEQREPMQIDTTTQSGLIEFARWYETADRRVALDVYCGDVSVSTVFLGLDHGFNTPRPVLFETMIFGGRFDQEQHRYCTWNEAEAGHHSISDRVLYAEGRRGYSRSHWRKIRGQLRLQRASLADALLAQLGVVA